MGGSHRGGKARSWGWALGVVALLCVALVAALTLDGDGDTVGADGTGSAPSSTAGTTASSAPTRSVPAAQATRSPTADAAPAPDIDAAAAQEACQSHVVRARTVLRAARSGVEHWNDHVSSRTELLAGRMTKDDVSAIWKRTRLAGPADLEAFQAAYDAYAAEREACAQAAGDLADRAVRTCAAAAAAADAAVQAAAVVLEDWSDHLENMVAHGRGDFDAAHAQDLWVEAWEEAPPHLEAYQGAVADLAATPACPEAPQS
jgi:hypothetical protein